MGLFSRKKSNNFENSRQAESPVANIEKDMELVYSSGNRASVIFKQGEFVDGKYLSKASVAYIHKDNSFVCKEFLLEPVIQRGENGIDYDVTREYYKNGRLGDVKGFFKEECVTEQLMGSNYIGKLEYDQTGKPIRQYDESFKQKYVAKFQAELVKKKEEEEVRRRVEAAQYKESLISGVRDDNGYQEALNREDARVRGEYNLTGKADPRIDNSER